MQRLQWIWKFKNKTNKKKKVMQRVSPYLNISVYYICSESQKINTESMETKEFSGGYFVTSLESHVPRKKAMFSTWNPDISKDVKSHSFKDCTIVLIMAESDTENDSVLMITVTCSSHTTLYLSALSWRNLARQKSHKIKENKGSKREEAL